MDSVSTFLDEKEARMTECRHDWTREEAERLYALPFAALMFRAQTVHRRTFDHIETASQLSIKTGDCPENCDCRSQSALRHAILSVRGVICATALQETSEKGRDGVARATECKPYRFNPACVLLTGCFSSSA